MKFCPLAYFEILARDALYLSPYWYEENFLPNTKQLYSSDISTLCEYIGRAQLQRFQFIAQWIEQLQPIYGIYSDITSISGYSRNIDFLEWGYNRDHDYLPQLNIGVVFCQNNKLPLYYTVHPGSIVDVTTLQNCIRYLHLYHIDDVLIILDRGFFSEANIRNLTKSSPTIHFIQPLPGRLLVVKDGLQKVSDTIAKPINAFRYHDKVLGYVKESLMCAGDMFEAHIYLNEEAELAQRHRFLTALLQIEDAVSSETFATLQDYLRYRNEHIPSTYHSYFTWKRTTLTLEKHVKNINESISLMGKYILISNKEGMQKEEVLDHYRRRDSVEKIFDIVKNKIDGERLRVHHNDHNEGRLFINFISFIIYSEISKVMQEKKIFMNYSVNEMIHELRKLKIMTIDKSSPFLNEITKKQRNIFKAFGITEELLYQTQRI